MDNSRFSPEEEELIEAGVMQYFKNKRAAEIKAEIDRRITAMPPNAIDCRLTKSDLAGSC